VRHRYFGFPRDIPKAYNINTISCTTQLSAPPLPPTLQRLIQDIHNQITTTIFNMVSSALTSSNLISRALNDPK
jgi:hypothetical protein